MNSDWGDELDIFQESDFEIRDADHALQVNSIEDISRGAISNAVLSAVLDIAPIAVYFKARDGTYVNLNRKAERLLSRAGESHARGPLRLRANERRIQERAQFCSARQAHCGREISLRGIAARREITRGSGGS